MRLGVRMLERLQGEYPAGHTYQELEGPDRQWKPGMALDRE
jgi:hypothetical protein